MSRKNIVQNYNLDENSSEESVVDDMDNDPDYHFSDASSLSDTRDAEEHTNPTRDTVEINFIDLKDWSDLSLERIAKRKSSSEVWNYFGILKKGAAVFKPMCKKFYCWPCFDKHKFKR